MLPDEDFFGCLRQLVALAPDDVPAVASAASGEALAVRSVEQLPLSTRLLLVRELQAWIDSQVAPSRRVGVDARTVNVPLCAVCAEPIP